MPRTRTRGAGAMIATGALLVLLPLLGLAYFDPGLARQAAPGYVLTFAIAGVAALGVYLVERRGRSAVDETEDD